MHALPHYYTVAANAGERGHVELTAPRLPALHSDSPAEFDGPGDCWSPETLLTGAIGDCVILTFRAVARASHLPRTSLRCEVTGTLDRIDRVTRFTDVQVRAYLTVPAGVDPAIAQRALEKAERGCLIANSLNAAVHFVPEIIVGARGEAEGRAEDGDGALTHA